MWGVKLQVQGESTASWIESAEKCGEGNSDVDKPVLHRTINVEEAPLHCPLARSGILAPRDDKLLPTVAQLRITPAADAPPATLAIEGQLEMHKAVRRGAGQGQLDTVWGTVMIEMVGSRDCLWDHLKLSPLSVNS